MSHVDSKESRICLYIGKESHCFPLLNVHDVVEGMLNIYYGDIFIGVPQSSTQFISFVARLFKF